jgi:hypothetical protein
LHRPGLHFCRRKLVQDILYLQTHP